MKPTHISSAYASWPAIADLSSVVGYQGLSEDRRKALFAPNKQVLIERMQRYLDPTISWADYKAYPGAVLVDDYVDFPAAVVREKALLSLKFSAAMVYPYAVRPFDNQYCFWSELRPLWRRHRPDFGAQVKAKQRFLVTRVKGGNRDEGSPLSFTSGFCDYHYLPPNASAFPMGLTQQKIVDTQDDWFAEERANLSSMARQYLAALELPDPDTDRDTAELLWMHALAIGYSPAYLRENAAGIRENWPRIPLPESRDALLTSASLGRKVAALLDTEVPAPGVTSGTIRTDLKHIAVVSRLGGGPLKPEEFALTAGWGSSGQGGITMPGKGKIEPRVATEDELNPVFGESATLDMYLNATAYWKNIPQPVYDFTIGGYQVIKSG